MMKRDFSFSPRKRGSNFSRIGALSEHAPKGDFLDVGNNNGRAVIEWGPVHLGFDERCVVAGQSGHNVRRGAQKAGDAHEPCALFVQSPNHDCVVSGPEPKEKRPLTTVILDHAHIDWGSPCVDETLRHLGRVGPETERTNRRVRRAGRQEAELGQVVGLAPRAHQPTEHLVQSSVTSDRDDAIHLVGVVRSQLRGVAAMRGLHDLDSTLFG